MNGGAWRATVRGVTESDPSGMNKQTSSHACIISLSITCLLSIYLSIAHHASVSIHIPHPSVSATYVASTYLHLLPKSLQSCPTLCDPVDCSPPGSSVRGTLQARVLEWVCHALLQGVFQPRDQTRSPVLLHCKFFTAKPWRKPQIISVYNPSLSIIYPLSIYHLIAMHHLFIYRSIYISIPISTDNI